jgi:hypothetical protein
MPLHIAIIQNGFDFSGFWRRCNANTRATSQFPSPARWPRKQGTKDKLLRQVGRLVICSTVQFDAKESFLDSFVFFRSLNKPHQHVRPPRTKD